MVGGIHAFLLIYIRQEAGGKKQTAGVELVVVLVFGIKAADMYVCLLYTSPSPRDCS